MYIAGNLPIKTLVPKLHTTNKYVRMRRCDSEGSEKMELSPSQFSVYTPLKRNVVIKLKERSCLSVAPVDMEG